MNKALNLGLAVVVAVLIGWYFSLQSQQEDLSHLIKKVGMPEYSGENLTAMVYDLNGKPQYLAKAKEIKRFEESGVTQFIQPTLELFDLESGTKQWQAVANQAEITKDKLLHLYGEVVLTSFDPKSRLQQIRTEQLTVNLTTHDISSGTFVQTNGMGFQTHGKGLKGNLKQQVATLLAEVKTQIEPTVLPPVSE